MPSSDISRRTGVEGSVSTKSSRAEGLSSVGSAAGFPSRRQAALQPKPATVHKSSRKAKDPFPEAHTQAVKRSVLQDAQAEVRAEGRLAGGHVSENARKMQEMLSSVQEAV